MPTSTTWTRYGSTVGAGPYWPSRPLVSGPRANPAVMANAARRPPAPSPEALDSSPSQALPTLKTMPLTTPCAKRARNSSARASPAAAKATEASAASTIPGSATRRRPRRSDSGPATSSAGTRPAA